MRISIPRKAITAALNCASKRDYRFYLNGVYIGFPNLEHIEVVSTDENTLFACVVEYGQLDKPMCPGFSMIVPRETCEALRKGKTSDVVLESMDDGRYIIDGQVFAAIDGKFPDFRRVIPDPSTTKPCPANYNPDLLLQCAKAMREFRGTRKGVHPFVFSQFGKSPGVMHDGKSDCLALCMPLREEREPVPYFGLRAPVAEEVAA